MAAARKRRRLNDGVTMEIRGIAAGGPITSGRLAPAQLSRNVAPAEASRALKRWRAPAAFELKPRSRPAKLPALRLSMIDFVGSMRRARHRAGELRVILAQLRIIGRSPSQRRHA